MANILGSGDFLVTRKKLRSVLAWMPVPLCHGWLHDVFQVNAELSNSGVESLKAGQGRFAFKPEWTICGLSPQNLRGG